MTTTRIRARLAVSTLLLLSTIVGTGALATSSANAATCSTASTGGTVNRTAAGRPYHLNVPAGLTGAAPVMLSLHGGGEPWNFHELETGWNAFAASKKFIVAYPEAINGLWNFNQGSPDIAYLEAVVADISGTWCVNSRRVHAEGYSNGGSMTNRLACDASDVFASVTSYAGSSATIAGSPCNPTRPIAIGQLTSAQDPILPFGQAARLEWIGHNNCTSQQFVFSLVAEVWRHRPCNGGVEVLWVNYYGGSHNWPLLGTPQGSDIRNRIWNLFQAYPLP